MFKKTLIKKSEQLIDCYVTIKSNLLEISILTNKLRDTDKLSTLQRQGQINKLHDKTYKLSLEFINEYIIIQLLTNTDNYQAEKEEINKEINFKEIETMFNEVISYKQKEDKKIDLILEELFRRYDFNDENS